MGRKKRRYQGDFHEALTLCLSLSFILYNKAQLTPLGRCVCAAALGDAPGK